ncbi:MAG: OmpA family protein [Candidatus Caldarchaeum sp.]
MKDGALYKFIAISLLIGTIACLGSPTSTMPQMTYTVFFDSNSYFIKESGKKVIREVSERAKSNPELLIVLEGYSDTTGDDALNLSLSRSRAEAVREHLIKDGVESERISLVPLGGTTKFSPAGEGESLALNRRVEIILSGLLARAAPEAEALAQSTSLNNDLSLYNAIDSSLKEIAPSEFRFDAPPVMRVGVGEYVEVSISSSMEKKLILSIKEKNLSGAEGAIINPALSFTLVGANFDIRENRPVQARSSGNGSLQWDVVPLSSGIQSLVLIASLDVNKPGQGTVRLDFPLIERVIEVKPHPTLTALTLLKKYSGIAISLLFVGFLAWYIKERWLEG